MADGKKGKKAGPRKVVPKQVFGIAIPKELRRAGDQLVESASGPAGRQMIAGAVTLAAAAAGAAVAAARGGGTAGAADGEANPVVSAVEQAADALLSRLFPHEA